MVMKQQIKYSYISLIPEIDNLECIGKVKYIEIEDNKAIIFSEIVHKGFTTLYLFYFHLL